MQVLKKTALGHRVSQNRRMSAYATYGLRLRRKLPKRLHGQSSSRIAVSLHGICCMIGILHTGILSRSPSSQIPQDV